MIRLTMFLTAHNFVLYYNNNNNNNSLYFQRVTHLAKKKLIFHEALYKLLPKRNTSIKYKDDLHGQNNTSSMEHFQTYIHTGSLYIHKQL